VSGTTLTLASTYGGITNGGFDAGSAPSTFTGWNTFDPDVPLLHPLSLSFRLLKIHSDASMIPQFSSVALEHR